MKGQKVMPKISMIETTELSEVVDALPSLEAHLNDLNFFVYNDIALDKHHVNPSCSALNNYMVNFVNL